MEDQFLRMAGHVGHPITVAAFALVIAAFTFSFTLRAGRPVVAWLSAFVFLGLGIAPYAVSAFLQKRGVYRIQVFVVRPDQSSADIAQIKSSNNGEFKMIDGGWELDVPPRARPAEGKLTFSAAVKDEFLKGSSTLVLAQDYYPTVTIPLTAETSAKIRGVVVDESLVAIQGAAVSVGDYPEVAVTDSKGNFVLPAHAGNGQTIEIHAQKGALKGHLSARAGKVIEIILSKE